MNKFFWLEVLLPILLSIILYMAAKTLLSKFQKRGYQWGALFSVVALFLMVIVWLAVSRCVIRIKCEAAYDHFASDPKMCDNPANGILAIVQMPILLVAWISISGIAIFNLRPLKKKYSSV